jgi:hypothetical protein
VSFQTIPGAAGTDETTFLGTEGVDLLLSLNTTGSKTVEALGGNDNITFENTLGVVGDVTVKGGAGNDTITIGSATSGRVTRLTNSSVNGGAGNDTISLRGALNSTSRGNEGEDVITLAGNYTSAAVNGGAGGDSISLSAAIQMEDTKILGGNDNDGAINLTGGFAITAIDSTVNGSKGNDTIRLGGAGTVSATGFTIFGGQGDDFINGATLNAASDGITFSGDKGNDQISTGAGDDLILGGDDVDVLSSTSGKNTIDGGAGNDRLTGGTAADSIDGGVGNDTIDGLAGNNTINGGDGNDTITVAAGDDEITGGAGSDRYSDTGGATYTGNNDFNIGLGDSSAATSGTTVTFDVFADLFTGAGATADIDLTTGLTNSLGGGDAGSANLNVNAAINIADEGNGTGVTFAEIKTAVEAAGLTASTATNVQAYTIEVAAQAAVAGVTSAGITAASSFVLLNDPNIIMNSGDVMFQVVQGDGANAIGRIDLN